MITDLPVSAIEARRARVSRLFDLYNARRFDEMLLNYADDVVFASPQLTEAEPPDAAAGFGKDRIRDRLAAFHDRFGMLCVLDVFAVQDQVSIVTADGAGRRFSFCIETAGSEMVKRLFVFEIPGTRSPATPTET